MVKCDYCSENLGLMSFKCRLCNGKFCNVHRLPENHQCANLPKIKVKNICNICDKELGSEAPTCEYCKLFYCNEHLQPINHKCNKYDPKVEEKFIEYSEQFSKLKYYRLKDGLEFYKKGEYGKALKLLKENLNDIEKRNDFRSKVECLNLMGITYQAMGDIGNAMNSFMQAKMYATTVGDKELYTQTINCLKKFFAPVLSSLPDENGPSSLDSIDQKELIIEAFQCISKGDFKNGISKLEMLHELVQISGGLEDNAIALEYLGDAYRRKEEPYQAVEKYQEALKYYRQLHDEKKIVKISIAIGDLYWNGKNYDSAIEIYKGILEIAENLGDLNLLRKILNYISQCYIKLKDINNILIYHEKLLKVVTSMGLSDDIKKVTETIVFLKKYILDGNNSPNDYFI